MKKKVVWQNSSFFVKVKKFNASLIQIFCWLPCKTRISSVNKFTAPNRSAKLLLLVSYSTLSFYCPMSCFFWVPFSKLLILWVVFITFRYILILTYYRFSTSLVSSWRVDCWQKLDYESCCSRSKGDILW